MRSQGTSGCCGGRKQTVTQCLAGGETDCPLGDKEMGSIQGGEIQTGGWRAFLDEVSQDLEDLRGVGAVARPRVGDHGDDFHGFVTTRAAQGALAGLRPAAALGIGFVDLLDQAGPCGAALLGRHRELGLRLLGRPDADGWLGWMVALPALGSEADEVRAARQPSRRASAGSRRSFGTAAACDLSGQGCREPERSTTRRCV